MTLEGPANTAQTAPLGIAKPSELNAPGKGKETVSTGLVEQRALSLRAQLMIWFGISFGVILSTIVAALVVIDGGRVFDADDPQYDWLISLVGIGWLCAFAGGLGAAYVILGAALRPLRQITAAARGMAPERIDESRIDMPEVGREVNEARRELNSALDRIEAGYQAQERFISNVSHELKTPIAIVQNEAQRLRRMTRTKEELETFVNDTATQMGRLGKMVESFLTLARIDHEERMQKNEEFWFQDLLVEAKSRSRAQALTHGVSIDLDLGPEEAQEFFDDSTWGDPELMSSAVENLIRNAIRFSPPEASVHVSLSGLPANEEGAEPSRAVIQVRDEGPGMPEELIETVFEPFQQAASERHSNRGTGLGLAIAHRVCTLHKGTIRAFNRTDGVSGCVIEIRLPFLVLSDWAADRPITADLTTGPIGPGIHDSRIDS